MKLRHLKRALPVGSAAGVAIAASSASTGSVGRGALIGLCAGLVGTLSFAFFEVRAEARREALGATLLDPPLRVKLGLTLAVRAEEAIRIYRTALESSGLRVKRTEIDDALKVVIVMKTSFNAPASRITAMTKPIGAASAVLEIFSVPRLSTVVADGGENYLNVFKLGERIKLIVPMEVVSGYAISELDSEDADLS